jgi:hypothetical protein
MPCFELVKKLPGRPDPAFLGVLQSLPDTFLGAGECSCIQQALIRFGILCHRRRLPVHRKHSGRLLFLSSFIRSPERRRKVVSD